MTGASSTWVELHRRAEGYSSRVQRYEILGDIASGGMGVVCVARLRGERGFSKLVAVKRIHPHLGASAQFQELLAREARLASLVRHPAVVQVHELTSQDGELMLVMDYVEGTSLRRLLDGLEERQTALPREVSVRIGIEVARALEAMHQARDEAGLLLGIAHRDVSPQNILVSFRGEVKLMDFGIATSLEVDHGTTSTIRGKPAYLAPEQLRGERADERADLWALGVILWEMLAGQRLFRGSNDFETVQRVQDGPLLRLDELDEQQFSSALADAVAAALTRPKDVRVASAGELAGLLESACPAARSISAAELASWARRAAPQEEARLQALTRGSSATYPTVSSPVARTRARRAGLALVGAFLGVAVVRGSGLHAPHATGGGTYPARPPSLPTAPIEPVPAPAEEPSVPVEAPLEPASSAEEPATTPAPPPSRPGRHHSRTAPDTHPASPRNEEPPRPDREGSSGTTSTVAPALDPQAPITEFPL